MITPKPLDALIEEARLSTLERYRRLSAHDIAGLARVAAAAAQSLEATRAAISFVDSSRVWFGGAFGFACGNVARSNSFCDAVVRSNAALLVPDALVDPRFWEHDLVCGQDGLRSYAGVPLVDDGGYTLGTVAVYAAVPSRFAAPVLGELGALAGLVRDFLSEAGAGIGGPADAAAEAGEPLRRVQGWLGVKTVGAKPGAKSGPSTGLLIVSVARGSPAAEAGLRPTDILCSIGGQAVMALPDIAAAMAGRAAGTRLPVRFRRAGRWHECEVEIKAKRRPIRVR